MQQQQQQLRLQPRRTGALCAYGRGICWVIALCVNAAAAAAAAASEAATTHGCPVCVWQGHMHEDCEMCHVSRGILTSLTKRCVCVCLCVCVCVCVCVCALQGMKGWELTTHSVRHPFFFSVSNPSLR